MFSFLTVFEGDLAIGVIALALGIAFSTKMKDFFKGVPADVRKALNGVETSALSNVKAAQAHVLVQIAASLPAVVVPPAPVVVVPAAPAAPTVV